MRYKDNDIEKVVLHMGDSIKDITSAVLHAELVMDSPSLDLIAIVSVYNNTPTRFILAIYGVTAYILVDFTHAQIREKLRNISRIEKEPLTDSLTKGYHLLERGQGTDNELARLSKVFSNSNYHGLGSRQSRGDRVRARQERAQSFSHNKGGNNALRR